jgi:hypothetical protein
MSSTLHVKLFNQFKEITDAARSAVSRHILPLLEGFRVSSEHDKMLTDLYEEWQAGCRAAGGALQRTLYPNEYQPMPNMPVDDEEHKPCRQMAAVLIERTVYDEHIAGRWFDAAAENIKNHPNCANHRSSCACKMALSGWTHASNKMQAQLLKAFYDAHSDVDKHEDYLDAVHAVAKRYGRTFEQQMEREKTMKQTADTFLAGSTAKKPKKHEECVFICYQDLNQADLEEYNLHGWYKVTKTAECYEFMLVETPFQDPVWRRAVADKKVTKIPLTKMMGVGSTSFQNVVPDKIQMG